VLEEHLRQFQLTGLIAAFCGDSEKIVCGMTPFYHVILKLLDSAPTLAESPVTFNSPAVYSADNWCSDQLAGYAGMELSITPKALLASHANLWSAAEKIRETAILHFVKCILWYYENHARDLRRTIKFVLDLYGHGFFTSQRVFADVMDRFSRLYASSADLSFLVGTKREDLPQINAQLTRVSAQLPELSTDQFEPILKYLIDFVQDLASEARIATNADAWLMGLAKLAGPATFLGINFRAVDVKRLDVLTRAALSAIEEMGADLFAVGCRFRTFASENLPLGWDFTGPYEDLATKYRATFPEDEWLDRLTDDRLVMPQEIKELIVINGWERLPEIETPPRFRLNTPLLAIPLCIACERNPPQVRSIDFTTHALTVAMKYLDRDTATKPTVSAARSHLINYELTELIESVTNVAEAEMKFFADRIAEFLGRYPWHALPMFLTATQVTSQPHRETASTALRLALLSAPYYIDAWRALAKLAEDNGNQDDAVALRSTADSLRALVEGRP
jgi:hypothetical protein